jgi:hypothetical protein
VQTQPGDFLLLRKDYDFMVDTLSCKPVLIHDMPQDNPGEAKRGSTVMPLSIMRKIGWKVERIWTEWIFGKNGSQGGRSATQPLKTRNKQVIMLWIFQFGI